MELKKDYRIEGVENIGKLEIQRVVCCGYRTELRLDNRCQKCLYCESYFDLNGERIPYNFKTDYQEVEK